MLSDHTYKMANNMMYVPQDLRVSKDNLTNEINQLGEDELATVQLLVKVDYVYHHHENNYDGGLSFLDRINRKLGRFQDNNWDIQQMKDQIRNSNNPHGEYMWVIGQMFSDVRNIAIYGV